MITATTKSAEATESIPFRGLVLYDGECRFCRNLARRFGETFNQRGFRFTPFPSGRRPSEMQVRTAGGRDFGGADAIVFLSSFVWWATPLFLLTKLPGARPLLHRLYRGIAARRSCDNGICQLPRNR
jgi:predicted DCC family thiol-disulfide oxidoreductase YuxK